MFAAGGNLGKHRGRATIATPLAQNNSSIYNIIYTYNNAPLTITPYLQFSHVDARRGCGDLQQCVQHTAARCWPITCSRRNSSWRARVEYIKTDGGSSDVAPTNLLYGAGSGAFSVRRVTPTFTYQPVSSRGADVSVVDITNLTAGDGFGHDGTSRTQARAILETGIIY